jgi:hypothetical protein
MSLNDFFLSNHILVNNLLQTINRVIFKGLLLDSICLLLKHRV